MFLNPRRLKVDAAVRLKVRYHQSPVVAGELEVTSVALPPVSRILDGSDVSCIVLDSQ